MGIQFLPLALVLSALSASAYGFEGFNIDCGSDVDRYTDENSLTWLREDQFWKDGKQPKSEVANTSNPISNDEAMNTLRYFTGGMDQKYCYQIPVPKGRKVLVRASFNYGNYDKKSSPPTFDLEFDDVHWDTVLPSSTRVLYYEVIYVVKRDNNNTIVCLNQTKEDQLPFMSALQVSYLGPTVYKNVDDDYALHVMRRAALAATGIIRYPEDDYDRLWFPVQGRGALRNISSSALIHREDTENDPPQKVLQNAITTPYTSIFISLLYVRYPFYMTMYFSELNTSLDDSTEKRSFRIYQNGVPFSKPIEPPYGSVLETSVSNLSTSSRTEISLRPTSSSTLPPLINAFELFYIRKLPAVETNSSMPMLPNMLPNGPNSPVTVPTSRSLLDAPAPQNSLGKSITTQINIPRSLVIIIWGIVSA